MENLRSINNNNLAFDKEKQIKKRSTLGSVIGVSLGFAASVALSKKGQIKQDIFIKNDFSKTVKNLYDYTKVDYEGLKGLFAMVFQAGGAALGSLVGGLSVYKNLDETPKEKIQNDLDKKAKTKEALFMTNNVLVPTIFVKSFEWGLHKLKQSKNQNFQKFASSKLTKTLSIALGLIGGMTLSMNLTNIVNSKYIERENADNKKIRPIDFIYHVDDIIPILISSKNPICDKIPIDRLLPIIYGFMGKEVGQKVKQKPMEDNKNLGGNQYKILTNLPQTYKAFK